MTKKIMGIKYGRGATATITNDGPAHGPDAIRKMFPDTNWIMVTPDEFNLDECMADRFGENAKIQKRIYENTPNESHIMIGGDHSVNFGHFAAIADNLADSDICLIYIDAHLDIHTPETSKLQASGAPHGTNVRALLGDGDVRWLALQKQSPALKPENLFYLGTRAFEPAEIEFAQSKNIYIRTPLQLKNESDWVAAVNEIRSRIGNRKFVVSFDFDAIDPTIFSDVLVPEPNGISLDAARYLVTAFRDAFSFEFVEYSPTGNPASASIANELVKIVYEN